MPQTNNTSNADKNSGLEVFAIFAAMIIIFLIWVNYPKFMQSMDNPVQDKNPKIVIPYKAQQEAEPAKDETQFQKVGEKYGTYGDSYGSLNTLFSGLAFAMLIISLFMQRQELQAQRKELEAQRNEIKESNAIADKQREITEQQAALNRQQIHDAKVQSFYTLLFKFLDEKRRKVNELELSRRSDVKGHYIFDYFLKGALERIKINYLYANSIENEPYEDLNLIFEDLIQDGHELSKNTLVENEYFEYICFILRFIEEHKDLGITDTATQIFISYQSINEMSSMFIISLENEELQKYIKKYALLRKFNTYEGDKHLLTLVNKTLGEKSYTP